MPVTSFFSSIEHTNYETRLDREAYTAFFGSVRVDLTLRPLEVGSHEIEASAIFGNVEVIVPADFGVRMESSAIFGSTGMARRTVSGEGLSHAELPEVDYTMAPVQLLVRATALFGNVSIVRVAGLQPASAAAQLESYDAAPALPEVDEPRRAYEGETQQLRIDR